VLIACVGIAAPAAVAQESEAVGMEARETDPRLQSWIELVYTVTEANEDAIVDRLRFELTEHLAGARDERGMTVLMHACRGSTPKVIRELLLKTPNPRARDHEGRTAMHHAAFHPNTEVTREVFTLMTVAGQGVEHGKDEKGMTMFMLLCREDHPIETIDAYAKRNAIHVRSEMNDLDESGHSAVSYAAINNTDDRVWDVLSKYGADLEKGYTEYGLLPLHLAARENTAEVVVAILRQGADVNARDKQGSTALTWALVGNRDGFMVPFLLQNGADATLRNTPGATMTHAAAIGGQDASTFKLLLDAGAPVDEVLPPQPSVSPARLYAQRGIDPEVWALLRERGADMNRKGEFDPPMLMVAIQRRAHEAFVEAMLEAGCDVNDLWEPANNSALLLACRGATPETIELLLNHGADATLVNAEGKGVMDYAAMNEQIQGHAVLERLRAASQQEAPGSGG
jgi:ankyrin repeat protein